MGKEGQAMPTMSDEWVEIISKRYIELYEQIIGKKFIPETVSEEDTKKRILLSLEKLGTL